MGSPWNADGGYDEGPDSGVPADNMVPSDPAVPSDPVSRIRETVVARQEERFGGIKIGSAFFGCLTAAAMTFLLAALAVAAGRAGLLAGPALVSGSADASAPFSGMTGAILLFLVPFLAFVSGGYVAGRMARFNGVGQGLMVWLWAVIAAAGIALLALVSSGQFNALNVVSDFLRVPVLEGQLGTTSIVAAIAVAAVALMGAVLGGLAGVHYHRKVDRVGFARAEEHYQP
ncbi:hypothetical protein ASF98_06345 [Arthrobacter sp. Leaf337]|uniref:hypothetical protein n=1 Tax=Arthrobacter sp. Leaf337 TaxID=1736342 RepID=UPI0006FA4E94|nr:hypothetical protein [Arthrobacter sp. Leaf337]KQR75441.1 hypothetical protein ASF98_06345 [Arthrobacter sp. Leaf337]